MKISASFLSMQGNRMSELDGTTVDYLHVDVMDGEFVKEKTVSNEEMALKLKDVTKPLDIHLMVKDVISYIDFYKNLNPKYIAFHYEATDDPMAVINYIRSLNIGVGLAINPGTPIDSILSYLDQVDLILIMSVYPGRGGQEFIKETEHKLQKLNHVRKIIYLNYKIEIDGGINNETIKNVPEADIAVSGNYITSSSDYQKQVSILKGDIAC
jgi:ribulose-phosphate 3-epimerase